MTMDPVLFILLLLFSLATTLVTMGMSNANRKGRDEKFFLLLPVLGFLGFMAGLVTQVSLLATISAFLLYQFLVYRLSKR